MRIYLVIEEASLDWCIESLKPRSKYGGAGTTYMGNANAIYIWLEDMSYALIRIHRNEVNIAKLEDVKPCLLITSYAVRLEYANSLSTVSVQATQLPSNPLLYSSKFPESHERRSAN